uniref:Glycerophosphodiester phosphodiesterase domain containing 3a n=1 Tax=Sinocyclocheilus anshuiensis TaxID=1608454 RepID=A0A671PTB9_9TELE
MCWEASENSQTAQTCTCHVKYEVIFKSNVFFKDQIFAFSEPLIVGIMASYLYYLLPAVGGYALTSLYFLKNPHILHKKKQTAFYCTHISHRGGTVSDAAEVGTEMLELDCHLTKDGHVTGQDVNISSLNLEVRGHFSTGSDRNFALLEDVFRKFPHIAVNIEVKENNSMLVEKISDLVKKYNREATSVWASVDTTIMKNCRKTNSSMPYMFTVKRGLKLLLLYYTGLLPFVPSERVSCQYTPNISILCCKQTARLFNSKVTNLRSIIRLYFYLTFYP